MQLQYDANAYAKLSLYQWKQAGAAEKIVLYSLAINYKLYQCSWTQFLSLKSYNNIRIKS